RVRFVPAAATHRLAIAVARESLPLLAHDLVAFRLTRRAAVTAVFVQHGRRVARARVQARAGLGRLRINAPPGEYELVLTAAAGKQRMATSHRVLLGGVLPLALAKGFGDACRRLGATRVDCVGGYNECGGTECYDFCSATAVVLRPDGIVYQRDYGEIEDGCPKDPTTLIKPHPRDWSDIGWRQAPPLR